MTPRGREPIVHQMARPAQNTAEKEGPVRGDRVVTTNRRATYDYFIEESLETGIVLTGTEIKSIRAGRASIAEAYVRVEDGELWLIGANIAPFVHGGNDQHEPARPRKLLAKRRQISNLQAATDQKGMTLVPLRLSLRHGLAKVDIGVARGKKTYDKRAATAEREATRDIQRALRDRG